MLTWTEFKTALLNKVVSIQYSEGVNYNIFAIDDSIKYECLIYKGTVGTSDGITISQGQNDTDKADWENNYKAYANRPTILGGPFDPRNDRRFGNLTAVGVPEVIVSSRPYNAQASNAQRSIKSTSATDSNGAGTGARVVRLTYLTSAFVRKTEDINTNGTIAVPTTATDICFVESFRVVQGVAAVGAIELWTAANGTGTAICGIGAATTDAFLCVHYVPVGMQCWILGWGVEATHSSTFGVKGKLNAQERTGSFTIDVIKDLFDANALVANARLTFNQSFNTPILVGEKTYVRPTVVPSAASIIIRAWLDFVEDKAII